MELISSNLSYLYLQLDQTKAKDSKSIVIHTSEDHNLRLDRTFLILGTLSILTASLYLLHCITRSHAPNPKKRFLDKKPAKTKRS